MKDKMKKNLLLLLGIILLNACTTTTDSNGTKTTTVVPLPPTNLTGKAISTTETNLSWTDNSTNEIGFTIERKTGNGNYSQLISLSSNVTTYTDASVSAGSSYTYRVYALNSAGNSAGSSV